jgi:glycosyltransferase involved in cell wall biosynthesis
VRIVQRLDGMNWLHRRRKTGVRHFLRAEYGNFILGFIRSRLVDEIIYQSAFAQSWWERVRGPVQAPARVIYNGVDLDVYTPSGDGRVPEEIFRLLLVEGNLGGGYEVGLETAVRLGEQLAPLVERPVELKVVGKAAVPLQEAWRRKAGIPVHFTGQVPSGQIPALDRAAHLLYSADLHAACPNAVIEALACGLPVAAFDTGALPELVQGDAGRVVPYGGDAWRLDPPDIPALALAAAEILRAPGRFRQAARRRAEAVFGLEKMVDLYLDSLYGR